MNKKGAISDVFILMAIGLAMLILVGVLLFSSNTMRNTFSAIDDEIAPGVNFSTVSEDTVGRVDDGMAQARMGTFILFFGMFLSILVSSFLVRVNPAFFIVYVFISIIAVIVAVPISNFYENFIASGTLSSTFQSFTATNFIILNLPIWIAVVSILGGAFLAININRGGDSGV